MTLAIVQARMSSRRLPGKVLADLAGAPMLARQIERIMRAATLDRIVVATSDDGSDDPIAQLGAKLGVDVFRGSLDDVLERFHETAMHYPGAPIVRLTADCPLCDPAVIDKVVAAYRAGETDYVSNTLARTWPDGLDVEVFSRDALDRAQREARTASEREHVTPYIYTHPDIFAIAQVRDDTDRAALRWTVDTPRDLDFVRAVYEALLADNPAFGMTDILALLEQRPDIAAMNSLEGQPA